VLLVDDDQDTLDLERLVLQSAGATVVCATSVEAALREHERQPAAVIVSDLAMPDLDGYALARTLRKGEHASAVPLIALSAHASLGTRARALASGFSSFLTKPVHPDVLVDSVASLLARTRGPKALS